MQGNINKTFLAGILPSPEVMNQCIHCGLCLSVCPTYDITKMERSSPRGRIQLIKSVAKGESVISNIFVEEMNFCLDCQACETACPAGVKYSRLVESARDLISGNKKHKNFSDYLKSFFLKNILANPANLKSFSKFLRFYQESFLKTLIEERKILNPFSKNFSEISKLSPDVSKTFSDELIPEVSNPGPEILYKAAFHYGCIMNTAYAEINVDTVEVLNLYGCNVVTPRNQVCCGSLHAHNGDISTAVELAKKNIDKFENVNYDHLVSNSAGCGAFMKEYCELLKDDEEYSEKAKIFSGKVKDVTEFLYDKKPLKGFKEIKMSATYHDACHLVHSQKISEEPRRLLSQIPGLGLKELEESNWCCGSAGIYNVTRFDDSMKFLERKMNNIEKTKAEVIITGNPGCINQLKYGSQKSSKKSEVLHPVTVIKLSLNQ